MKDKFRYASSASKIQVEVSQQTSSKFDFQSTSQTAAETANGIKHKTLTILYKTGFCDVVNSEASHPFPIKLQK